MSCCSADMAAATAANAQTARRDMRRAELEHAGVAVDGGTQFALSVPAVHCGGCMRTIEGELAKMPGVRRARVNLTLKRVTVVVGAEGDILDVAERLEQSGFPPMPVDLGDLDESVRRKPLADMIKAMAVAGFAAANIMLLSVSVWSGAEAETRQLFHLISALIAVPAVAYSGQIFFRSAWTALRHRRLNMDVPISLGILLATAMSLFESLTGGEEAYFDAAVMLMFFLLVGRTLDLAMREKVRDSVGSLARLASRTAMLVRDGETSVVPVDEVQPGDTVRVLAGNRFPVDGEMISGNCDVDRSLVTGESQPVALKHGDRVESGVLNLTGPVDIKVMAKADASFVAEIGRMLQAAENGRGAYVRMADRMARIYAPAVHLLALLAFVGWMIATGGDWHTSIFVAISVLIITCPCALALAVPVAQVVAAGRLFRAGIMMRDGSALERLAEIDAAVFDKTGTLTTGTPEVQAIVGPSGEKARRLMASLAAFSAHPAACALARHLSGAGTLPLEAVTEYAGKGVEARQDGLAIRLGRPDWVAEIASAPGSGNLSFAWEGGNPVSVTLSETLRDGADIAVTALTKNALPVEILSGDSDEAVAAIADALAVPVRHSRQTPQQKFAHLEGMRASGRRVLMVGDGINDAPSLAAAHVSMAPASAVDVGRNAADFVLARENLDGVPFAWRVARSTGQVVRQNFGIAFAYNCIAVPLALAGQVTPLIAALVMSASSIVVVANSMRLNAMHFGEKRSMNLAGTPSRGNRTGKGKFKDKFGEAAA